MPCRPSCFAPLASLLLLAALLGACSGAGIAEEEPTAIIATVTRTPPTDGSPVATEATAPTAPQPTPSPTPAPPATATPPTSLRFEPAQVPQGGATVVYLLEAATSATVSFEGRRYPMLHHEGRWWAIIGLGALVEPGLYPVSVSYTPSGRTDRASVVASLTVTDRDFAVEYIELDPQTAALLAPDVVQAELAQRAVIFAGYTAQRLWSGSFQPPAGGTKSSIYGEGRSYNGGPVTDYHRGTDFIGDIGDLVFAAASGRIVFTGALQVRGNAIVIDHGAGVFTAYHHLSSIGVSEGQAVAVGQPIGAIGSTGLVTGPHLHWEVVIRGVEVDGEPWLAAPEIGP